MKNGVPWDEAWSMDREERAATAIVFGQFEGGVFDFDTMTWQRRS